MVILKKILIILFGIIVVVGLFININAEQEQAKSMIISKLEDKGFDNGGREFIFSLKNVGKNNAT